MSLSVINDNANNGYIFLSGSNALFLEGGQVTVDATYALVSLFGNNTVTANGTILSVQTQAIEMGYSAPTSGEIDLLVGDTGSIISVEDAAITVSNIGSSITNHGDITSFFNGPTFNAGIWSSVNFDLVNTGSISAEGGVAVKLSILSTDTATDSFFDNSGTLRGMDGIRIDRGTLTLINSGEIIAQENAIEADVNARLLIENFGLIRGSDYAIEGEGASLQHDRVSNFAGGVIIGDIYLGPGNNRLINDGEVTGEVRMLSGIDRVENTGLIRGDILLGFNNDTLINHGTIFGNVLAGDDGDRIVNSGRIEGSVLLEHGDDTLDARGGEITGLVNGGVGADVFYIDQAGISLDGETGSDLALIWASDITTSNIEEVRLKGGDDISVTTGLIAELIVGNTGVNRIEAGSGADTIVSGAGDDEIYGGNDDDLITGGAGSDEILGENGNDLIRGKGGDDEILGGDGDDTITAGTGNDTILPGQGADFIRGDQGQDVIVFENASEMNDDLIRGFASGEDIIDLSGINDDSFDFIGLAEFSASGEMELRYRVTGSGNAVVLIDTDGDGTFDARMTMFGVSALAQSDFIL